MLQNENIHEKVDDGDVFLDVVFLLGQDAVEKPDKGARTATGPRQTAATTSRVATTILGDAYQIVGGRIERRDRHKNGCEDLGQMRASR